MASAFPVAASSLVALLSLVVSGAGYRAMVRTGNPTLLFVVAAFLTMAAKNLAKVALLLSSGEVPLGWELAFGAADVLVVALVAWPFLRRLGP